MKAAHAKSGRSAGRSAGTSGPRALWKGAISFGLVHIPVSLHPATREHGIDFDWLDKRSMDPVGYKRVNKKTGKEIAKDDIVKGVEIEDGRYVVMSEQEIGAAYPRQTQSVDIEAFVSASEIPFVYLDRPYYLAPAGKGEKVYALLRETLLKTQRVGLARVVIQTRQHLAALVPVGPALVLNLLRWGEDIRPWTDLPLPAEGSQATRLSERELAMAAQLVDDMTTHFDPAQFRDSFQDEVMALVHRKAEAGETEAVEQLEALETPLRSADVIDLTELLKRSLKAKPGPDGEAAPAPAPARAKPRSARAGAARKKRAA